MATRTMRKMLGSISLFAMLLVFKSVGFGQTFGDSVNVLSVACTDENRDSLSGNTANDFTLFKHVNSTCSQANATAQAVASLGLFFGGDSLTKTSSGGSAGANSDTFDTLLIKPPSGFTGTSVEVGFSAPETFRINGAVFPMSAKAEICWLYTGISKPVCHEITSNGSSMLTFSASTIVKKTSTASVFKLFIEAKTEAGAATGASAQADFALTQSFRLPNKNWTFKWASGE